MKLFYVIQLLGSFPLLSQNLIPNPGFEEYDYLPVTLGAGSKSASHWNFIGKDYLDYYHRDAKTFDARVPENSMGYQHAHSGSAYIGFCTQYSEILYAKLKSPLEKDATYCLGFYLSKSDYMPKYIKTLSAFFTSAQPTYANVPGEDDKRQLSFFSMDGFRDTAVWVFLSAYYKALGDERYIAIGYIDRRGGVMEAHYMIDDVSLIRMPPEAKCTEEKVSATDLSRVLKGVNFETGSDRLTATSLKELDRVAEELKKIPGKKIEIGGHTDSSGNEARNLILSEKRARAVVKYLVSKGVNVARLSAKGYGSLHPLETNSTPEGRAVNRRVEVKIAGNGE